MLGDKDHRNNSTTSTIKSPRRGVGYDPIKDSIYVPADIQ